MTLLSADSSTSAAKIKLNDIIIPWDETAGLMTAVKISKISNLILISNLLSCDYSQRNNFAIQLLLPFPNKTAIGMLLANSMPTVH